MPCLTLVHPKDQRGMGGWDRAGRWAEEVGEGEPGERRLNEDPGGRPRLMFWCQTLRSWRPWSSLAPVGVVWSVSQLEVLLPPSLSVEDVCCRLLSLCLLWMVVGGCIYALRRCLRPRQTQEELLSRKQQEVGTGSQNNQYLWMSQRQNADLHLPLILALADSLLLCVLQEPLPELSVPHIEGLLSRLEAVADTLHEASIGSVAVLEEDRGSGLTDKPKHICIYLQQRVATLRRLVRVQGELAASVSDMLQGLDGLWAQLEELHAGVTLTKQGGRGHRDLASAQTDAETLCAVLGRYRSRLQSCQNHLKDSTQLLQELSWSHGHLSSRTAGSGESVWPELLLQSNIEQFDKVQESFISLEQQTATFQAHLEGLGKGSHDGHVGPLALANGAPSPSASPQTPQHTEELTSADPPLSLCERSALHFSSTIGRLRKSGRRK